MRLTPKISVCIPVYNTEQYLPDCLESLRNQTFKDFEVIVVDDCSPCTNSDKSAKKICKSFAKHSKIPVNFVSHSFNKGLVEARRTAVYEAKGTYIFNLDSDDKIPPKSLEILYNKALETTADIIHGGATVCGEESSEYSKKREEKINLINPGLINTENNSNEKPVLNNYLVEKKHMGFLWGKLIKREVYIRAFEHISPVFCTMAEDVLQYVWLAYEAKSYFGIPDKIYEYSINTGISSRTKITEISQWERVCSTASVFTSIFSHNEELETKLSQEQQESLQYLMIDYIRNNYKQWEVSVAEEIKDEAYDLLCEYWGRDFIKKIDYKI